VCALRRPALRGRKHKAPTGPPAARAHRGRLRLTPMLLGFSGIGPSTSVHSAANWKGVSPGETMKVLLTGGSGNLGQALVPSGVDVTLEVVPEMQPVFQFLAGSAPEADAAIRRLADWVRPKFGSAEAGLASFRFCAAKGASREKPSTGQEGLKIVGGPAVRIPLPPAESPSLAPSRSRTWRTPAFRAGVRGWVGDRVGRDAQGVSRSRQPAAISLSGHIPVPQCR